MSSTIDVLLVFDCAAILQNTPDRSSEPDKPMHVDDAMLLGYISLITPAAARGASTRGEPTLLVHTCDTIRWRATSLSPTEHHAALYEFIVGTGGVISSPTFSAALVNQPAPNLCNPAQPGLQTVQGSFWCATVQADGTVSYTAHFVIMDACGTTKWYFSFDPYIKDGDGATPVKTTLTGTSASGLT